jgi:hypothetical protein
MTPSSSGRRERPIIFTGEMVRAILAGRKTQTRRVVNPQPGPEACVSEFEHGWHFQGLIGDIPDSVRDRIVECPHGRTGDHLWVREKHLIHGNGTAAMYAADFYSVEEAGIGALYGGWRPSIHMPRWASRITLEIAGVRVERLTEIDESGAIAEGFEPTLGSTAANLFFRLWDRIHGDGSWSLDPWVWVIDFRMIPANSRDLLSHGTQGCMSRDEGRET